jgi:glutamine cyclotransferase
MMRPSSQGPGDAGPRLYESPGKLGKSQLRGMDTVTGAVPSQWTCPRTFKGGELLSWANARRLVDSVRKAAKADVLNGIASALNDEFLLTGKYWPTMFRPRNQLRALSIVKCLAPYLHKSAIFFRSCSALTRRAA